MSYDVGKATEGLENELWCRWSDGKVGEWALLFLEPFRHFTYVTTHSPTLPSLYLRHSSFFNPSVASPTSQFILQPFFRFSYVTSSSLNSPGEPPMLRRTFNKLSTPVSYIATPGVTLHVQVGDMSWHVAVTFTNQSDVSAGNGRMASAMMCSSTMKMELRSVIKFLTKEGKKSKETMKGRMLYMVMFHLPTTKYSFGPSNQGGIDWRRFTFRSASGSNFKMTCAKKWRTWFCKIVALRLVL